MYQRLPLAGLDDGGEMCEILVRGTNVILVYDSDWYRDW